MPSPPEHLDSADSRGPAPLSSTEGPLYEYACHEGNYAMEHILRGARAQDGAGADFNPVAPLTLIRGGNP